MICQFHAQTHTTLLIDIPLLQGLQRLKTFLVTAFMAMHVVSSFNSLIDIFNELEQSVKPLKGRGIRQCSMPSRLVDISAR